LPLTLFCKDEEAQEVGSLGDPLLVLDDEHGIPAALWTRLRAHLAA